MQQKQAIKLVFNSPLRSGNSEQSETKLTYFRSTHQNVTVTKSSNFRSNQSQTRRPVSLSHQLNNSSKKTSQVLHFDKEELVEENRRLKQTIALLNTEIIQLRKKMTISQRQTYKATETTDQLTKQLQRQLENLSVCSLRKVNLAIKPKMPNYLRDRLETKYTQQLIQSLKKENEMIKRLVKYTQLKQLQIQNQQLRVECSRIIKMMGILQQNNKRMQTKMQQNNDKFAIICQKQAQKSRALTTELRILKEQLNKSRQNEQKYINQLNKIKSTVEIYKESKDKQKRTIKTVQKSHQKYAQKQVSNSKDREGDQSQAIFYHKNRIVQAFEQLITFQTPKLQTKQLKILAQTLKYKLQGFQYCLQDLDTDLRQSKMEKFDVKQLCALLSCQPFLLNESSIKLFLTYLFEGQQSIKKCIEIQMLLIKIHQLIPHFRIMDYNKYNQLKSKWKKHLSKLSNPSQNIVTKQQFENWIIKSLIKNEQMQCLIAEACTVSEAINKLNISAFLQHIQNDQ